jgi:hypothetical protein
MKIYKIVIDEAKIDYDKKDIQALELRDLNTVIKMIENDPSSFKDDSLVVLKWYNK